jgi:hypothetical protein
MFRLDSIAVDASEVCSFGGSGTSNPNNDGWGICGDARVLIAEFPFF